MILNQIGEYKDRLLEQGGKSAVNQVVARQNYILAMKEKVIKDLKAKILALKRNYQIDKSHEQLRADLLVESVNNLQSKIDLIKTSISSE